jgi:hypothetical protein
MGGFRRSRILSLALLFPEKAAPLSVVSIGTTTSSRAETCRTTRLDHVARQPASVPIPWRRVVFVLVVLTRLVGRSGMTPELSCLEHVRGFSRGDLHSRGRLERWSLRDVVSTPQDPTRTLRSRRCGRSLLWLAQWGRVKRSHGSSPEWNRPLARANSMAS